MTEIIKCSKVEDMNREFKTAIRRSYTMAKHTSKRDLVTSRNKNKKIIKFDKGRCKCSRRKNKTFLSQYVKNSSTGTKRHQAHRLCCISEPDIKNEIKFNHSRLSSCRKKLLQLKARRKRKLTDEHIEQINEAFTTLRGILPLVDQPVEDDPTAAKVSTLRLAASYIQALADMLRETHLTEDIHSSFALEHNYSYVPPTSHCHVGPDITKLSESLVGTCQ